jgi:restriction system protein
MLIACEILAILDKKGRQPMTSGREQLSFLKHTSLLQGLPAAAPRRVIQTALLFQKRNPLKFKMAEKSLFAILLRSSWWISLSIAAVIALASKALLPPPYFPFGAMGGFPFVVIAMIALWRQLRAPSTAHVEATLAQINAMPWREFSAALEQALMREGFEVRRVDLPAADFELLKGGRTVLLGGKRWKAARLGLEVLQSLETARSTRDASSCICVATGEVSDTARAFAAQHQIRVIQGTELAQLLRPVLVGKPAA